MSQKHNYLRWYIKECDKAFSKLITVKGRCERCGITTNLQASHVIPRTNKTLRWDIFNCLCLCMRCHLWWAHKDPLAFADWFVTTFPARAKYLEENRNRIIKRKTADYKFLLEAINNKELKKLITFYPLDI